MAPPGGVPATTHPGKLIAQEQERRKDRSRGPAQRGDVTRARHFSPPLSPPSLGLPVLDVAPPPSTLTLRACLRAAEVAARAGRSCALLLLVLLWPRSLPGRLGLRSRRGARVTALRKPKQLGAGPGGKAGERVAEGAARTGGRPRGKEAGAAG